MGVPRFVAGVRGLGADLQVEGVDLVGVLVAVVGEVVVDVGSVCRRTVGYTCIYFTVEISFLKKVNVLFKFETKNIYLKSTI